MFLNKTVFITGAGASWHYGYPLGEDLVRRAIQRANLLADFLKRPRIAHVPKIIEDRLQPPVQHPQQSLPAWESLAKDCQELSRRLTQAHPLVIDYFLGHNPKLQLVGRFLIAWIILECDAYYQLTRTNRNRPADERDKAKDNWCRFLLHKLTNNCRTAHDLLKNNVTFVTFNYDVSLQRNLYDGLSSIEMFGAEPKVIEEFFGSKRFLHVYGQVRDCPPSSFDDAEQFATFGEKMIAMDRENTSRTKVFLDRVYEASKRIRTIDPDDKGSNDETIISARAEIHSAECLYILGYSFDGNNNKRIGLEKFCLTHKKPERPTGNKKCIMFTNYGDRNKMNRVVSNLFLNRHDGFLTTGPVNHGDPTAQYYIEKSVGDVYGALEVDFDDLETQRLFQGRGRRI